MGGGNGMASVALTQRWWSGAKVTITVSRKKSDVLLKDIDPKVWSKNLGSSLKAVDDASTAFAKSPGTETAAAATRALEILKGELGSAIRDWKGKAGREKDAGQKEAFVQGADCLAREVQPEVEAALKAVARQAAASAGDEDDDAGVLTDTDAYRKYVAARVARLKKSAMSFALAIPGSDPEAIRIMFHPSRPGKSLLPALKPLRPKRFTFGRAGTQAFAAEHGLETGTKELVLLIEGKMVPKLARQVRLMLRAVGVQQFKKVTIIDPDGTLLDADSEDEELEGASAEPERFDPGEAEDDLDAEILPAPAQKIMAQVERLTGLAGRRGADPEVMAQIEAVAEALGDGGDPAALGRSVELLRGAMAVVEALPDPDGDADPAGPSQLDTYRARLIRVVEQIAQLVESLPPTPIRSELTGRIGEARSTSEAAQSQQVMAEALQGLVGIRDAMPEYRLQAEWQVVEAATGPRIAPWARLPGSERIPKAWESSLARAGAGDFEKAIEAARAIEGFAAKLGPAQDGAPENADQGAQEAWPKVQTETVARIRQLKDSLTQAQLEKVKDGLQRIKALAEGGKAAEAIDAAVALQQKCTAIATAAQEKAGWDKMWADTLAQVRQQKDTLSPDQKDMAARELKRIQQLSGDNRIAEASVAATALQQSLAGAGAPKDLDPDWQKTRAEMLLRIEQLRPGLPEDLETAMDREWQIIDTRGAADPDGAARQAIELVQRLTALLKEHLAPYQAAHDRQKAHFDAIRDGLDRTEASAIAAGLTRAQERIEGGDFDGLMAEIDQLAARIAGADLDLLRARVAREEPREIAAAVWAIWQRARAAVGGQIDTLATAIAAEPGRSAELVVKIGLAGWWAGSEARMKAAVDQFGALSWADLRKADRLRTAVACQDHVDFVAAHPAVGLMEANPFRIAVPIRSEMQRSLAMMKALILETEAPANGQ